jgi:hypothetical protein
MALLLSVIEGVEQQQQTLVTTQGQLRVEPIAAALVGTLVSRVVAFNPADVPVAAVDTVIAAANIATTAGQLIDVEGIASVQNFSEALGASSNLTLRVTLDGVDLPPVGAAIGSYAAGATGQTVTCQHGQAAPLAGAHVVRLVATSTSDVGNSRVPARLGKLVITTLN